MAKSQSAKQQPTIKQNWFIVQKLVYIREKPEIQLNQEKP